MIAGYLKIQSIEKKFLMDYIQPCLNQDNVIFFINDSFNKLQQLNKEEGGVTQSEDSKCNEEYDMWFEFFSYALDLAAYNI